MHCIDHMYTRAYSMEFTYILVSSLRRWKWQKKKDKQCIWYCYTLNRDVDILRRFDCTFLYHGIRIEQKEEEKIAQKSHYLDGFKKLSSNPFRQVSHNSIFAFVVWISQDTQQAHVMNVTRNIRGYNNNFDFCFSVFVFAFSPINNIQPSKCFTFARFIPFVWDAIWEAPNFRMIDQICHVFICFSFQQSRYDETIGPNVDVLTLFVGVFAFFMELFRNHWNCSILC